jgi:hypothetical protein
MRRLRPALFFVASAASVASQAEGPPCANWGGVKASRELHFIEPSTETLQSALVDLEGRFGPSWLESQIQDGGLRFENKMPGLGLATTIYHVQIDWITPLGRVLATQSYPSAGQCAAISLYPGHQSGVHHLKRPESVEALRVRLRVWAVAP